jgi:hypothetical protein
MFGLKAYKNLKPMTGGNPMMVGNHTNGAPSPNSFHFTSTLTSFTLIRIRTGTIGS